MAETTSGAKKFPDGLKYHPEHTWVRLDGDIAWVGISDYAQSELGEVIFIELPRVGGKVTKGQPFGNAESVKTVSALYAPVSGQVDAVNADLEDRPDLVNVSPYGDGWIIKIRTEKPEELAELLSAEAYTKTLQP